jgi:undecaprenyl-phosphate 4-deoxy-4-formamido-L-arabinose transferase
LIQKLTQHTQPFVFIDGLIHWHTTYLGYCEVDHKERAVGRSNYTVKKLVSLTMNLIFNFTVLPLRFVTYLGVFTAIISFCFGFYFILNKLMHDVPIGYTSVIVSLFFSTGLILISLGIIGEYLSRIFVLQNHKPQYSVAEIRKGE